MIRLRQSRKKRQDAHTGVPPVGCSVAVQPRLQSTPSMQRGPDGLIRRPVTSSLCHSLRCPRRRSLRATRTAADPHRFRFHCCPSLLKADLFLRLLGLRRFPRNNILNPLDREAQKEPRGKTALSRRGEMCCSLTSGCYRSSIAAPIEMSSDQPGSPALLDSEAPSVMSTPDTSNPIEAVAAWLMLSTSPEGFARCCT